jgi:hypothetical protein
MSAAGLKGRYRVLIVSSSGYTLVLPERRQPRAVMSDERSLTSSS